MGFIKRGDGKITRIIEGVDLSEEQKKTVQKISSEQLDEKNDLIKQSKEDIKKVSN